MTTRARGGRATSSASTGGKRSIELDLEEPGDVELAAELIRRADVVVEDGGVRSVRSPLRGLVEARTRPPQLGEHSEELRRWLRAPGGSSSEA